MKTLVIDASVAGKLLFDEPCTADAETVMRRPRTRFVAPDLLPIELSSIIWKRHRRQELTRDEAAAVFERIETLPIDLLPTADVLAAAFEIAISTDRTVYDCVYIATAVAERGGGGVLITADERLVNALKPTAIGPHVQLLGSNV